MNKRVDSERPKWQQFVSHEHQNGTFVLHVPKQPGHSVRWFLCKMIARYGQTAAPKENF